MAISVHEITMVAPDIICIEYRDEDKIPGEVYEHGTVETGDYNKWLERTHPTRGTLACQITGKNKEYWWFADVRPTDRLDRVEVDTLANWGTIGGLSVTGVYRRTTPYTEGMHTNTINSSGSSPLFFSAMRHCVYLKLSGNLAQSAHTIVHPSGLGLSNSAFTFNDKTTRCSAIRGTLVGHRAADAQKKAFLGQWIPFYGTEGAVEYATAYSISQFYIIDRDGNEVAGPFNVTLRTSPTDGEPVHGSTTSGSNWNSGGDDVLDSNPALKYYVSLTQATIDVQSISVANPAVVTAAGHGLSDGNKITLREIDINFSGTRGMSGLSGVFARVADATTDTFTMKRLSDDAAISSVGQTALQGGAGNGTKIYHLHRANRAGTHVYALDFSSWTDGFGSDYRIYIPGLGVSDPFFVHDGSWHVVAKALAQGLYNQRNGMALSASVGGYERPVAFRHGINGVSIKRTTLPGYFSSESGFGGVITTGLATTATWVTADTVDWWGAHQDAGDWDSILNSHAYGYWFLLDLAERISAVREADFGIPKSSVVVGSTYSGTDSLPDLVHEVIWGLDTFRRNQLPDGSVYGGLQFGNSAGTAGGGGAGLFNTTWSWQNDVVVMAPDHIQTFMYAGAAAKLSKVLRVLGFTTLADTWLASAEAAYDWAELIYTDQTERDAYYLTAKTNAGWSDATYNSQMSTMQTTWVPRSRPFALASLLSAVTGNATKVTKYKTPFDADPPDGTDTIAFIGGAQWEYINDTNADATIRTALRNIILGNANNYYVAHHEATASYEWPTRGAPFFHQQAYVFTSLIWAYQTQTDAALKTKYLKALQAQMAHFLGCNALGRSFVTGLGTRTVNTQLHADGQMAGRSVMDGFNRPPGTPCYVYSLQGGSTVNAFNLNIALPEFPHPDNATNVANSDYPADRLSVPLFEAFVESPWAIAANEYTIGGQTMPWLMAAAFLHAWDGNETGQRIKRVRWS